MPTPIIVESSEVVTITTPVAATSVTIEPVNIVALSVPEPTLVDGRPQ